MIFYTPSKLNYNISTINRWITNWNVTFSIFIPHKSVDRNYSAGNDAASNLVGPSCKLWLVWIVLKLKKAVTSRSCAVMIDHHLSLALISRPVVLTLLIRQGPKHRPDCGLRLIRSTLEIMRDITLVCESTNTTIVFSQAALLTGGFTEDQRK